jgi:hypothetical protein
MDESQNRPMSTFFGFIGNLFTVHRTYILALQEGLQSYSSVLFILVGGTLCRCPPVVES